MKRPQMILACVLAAIALAGGAYALLSQKPAVPSAPEMAPGGSAPAGVLPEQGYSNEAYGIRFDYPGILIPVSEGPNGAERSVQNGEQISGTIQPVLDTVSFRDPSGNEYFRMQVFPPSDTEISEEAYKSGPLGLGTPCDTRYSDQYSAPQIGGVSYAAGPAFSVTLMDPDPSKGGAVCYFFKNLKSNPVVLSMIPQKDSPVPVAIRFPEDAASLQRTAESVRFFPTKVVSGDSDFRSLSDKALRDAVAKQAGAKVVSDSAGNISGDIPGAGHYSLDRIKRADLNGDGYEDALGWWAFCGASCGNGLSIYLNNGDGTASLLDAEIPGYIDVGADQSALKDFSVSDGGVISVTAAAWQGGDLQAAETRKFVLKGGKIVSATPQALFAPEAEKICTLSGNAIDDGSVQQGLTFFAKGDKCATLSGFAPNGTAPESVTFAGVTKSWPMVELSFYNANFSPDGKHFAYTASNLAPNGRGDFYYNLNGKFQRFVVSDNIAQPVYNDVYYPQYSKDGAHLGFCATKNGDYFKVIDGVESKTTKDDYFLNCDSLFGFKQDPALAGGPNADVVSPDGNYEIKTFFDPASVSSGTNCNMADCPMYMTVTKVSDKSVVAKYGPSGDFSDISFSPDSTHYAYVTNDPPAGESPISGPQNVLKLDGKTISSGYDELFNIGFSADGQSLTYNARLGKDVYYAAQPVQ